MIILKSRSSKLCNIQTFYQVSLIFQVFIFPLNISLINNAILIVLALIPLFTVGNTVILILVLLVLIGKWGAVIAVCQIFQILLKL